MPVFPSTIRSVWESFRGGGVKEILNLNGHPQVKNARILIPSILGFNASLLLDDGVVLDRGLLARAAERLGEEFSYEKSVGKLERIPRSWLGGGRRNNRRGKAQGGKLGRWVRLR